MKGCKVAIRRIVRLMNIKRRNISILRISMYLFVFFFFQAEDGIRDYKVTGVQTCALPILPADAPLALEQRRRMRADEDVLEDRHGREELDVLERARDAQADDPARRRAQRSEERRVGKECRSRWSPYH